MKLRLPLCLLLSIVLAWPLAVHAQDEAAPKADAKTAAALPARRTPWTTSKITGSPSPPAPYVSERVFPSLTFDQPGEMVVFPDGKRFGLIEVKGKIFSFPATPDAPTVETDLFADLSKLHPDFYRVYGLTFHPKFAENRTCYVCYVLKPKIEDGSRVSRFQVTDTDPPRLIPESEEVLITWMSGGHNGGHLQFGPDGMLYITTGDGGESFPPDGRNTGQDVGDLLASILRIDVDRTEPGRKYAIPQDNPFVGWEHPGKPALGGPAPPTHAAAGGKLVPQQAGAPPAVAPRPLRGEVWAYGLRNPWKMCFDPADGSLWTADVGWEMWEMVYRVVPGGNYGWSLVEGRQPVHRERLRGPTPIIPPTVEHDHTESRSITGGYFWGSSRLPELKGAYVYGDYVTGKVWALRHEGEKITWKQELVDTPLQIVTFGPSADGEVYLVDWAGTIHRLAPNPRRTANAAFPKLLSETGLFESVADQKPAPGVYAYSINAEPWADGTTAERFVALPGKSQLGVFKKTDVQIGYIAGEWEFPSDGVLVKTVSIDLTPGDSKSRRRLETQILHYDVDTWRGYNYLWNEAQTDAVLAETGSDRVLTIADSSNPSNPRSQVWHHASRLECLLCHTTRSGTVQGFRVPQLARASAGRGDAARTDPLDRLSAEGLFSEPLPGERKPWADPYDASASLEERARSYLHVNCAHCHRRGGGGSAAFDVQHQFPLEKTNLVGSRPTQGTFNIYDAQVVKAGDPYHSVLYYRMAKLGPGHMPQFGSGEVDRAGLKLIHDWIASLPGPAPVDPYGKNMSAAADLVATPSRALKSLYQAESAADDAQRRTTIVSAGLEHPDPLVRDLFEPFLPPEKRTKRLDASVKAADILAIAGDAAEGARLFAAGASVQCRNCHKVGEVGRAIGPDLSTIGRKLDRAKLVESILEPSKTIDPQFATYQAETADGRVVSGILVGRTETEVVLRDVEGKDLKLAAADVETFTPQQKSLMPELLVKDLTARQFADLLAYLSTLK